MEGQKTSPQREKGYTGIAHEILEALAWVGSQISGAEHGFIYYLLRVTYGNHKRKNLDGIWYPYSNKEWAKALGMLATHVSRTKKKLLARNMIRIKGNQVAFQKDYTGWVLPKQVTNANENVTQIGHKRDPNRSQKLPKQVTNVTQIGHNFSELPNDYEILTDPKERKKKEKRNPPVSPQGGSNGFDRFWKAYPRKVGKAKASKKWKRMNPGPELQATIMAALEAHKKTDQWTKDNGQFIPHPTTWLNGKRWEDDLGDTTSKPKREKRYYDNTDALADPDDDEVRTDIRGIYTKPNGYHHDKEKKYRVESVDGIFTIGYYNTQKEAVEAYKAAVSNQPERPILFSL